MKPLRILAKLIADNPCECGFVVFFGCLIGGIAWWSGPAAMITAGVIGMVGCGLGAWYLGGD